MSPQISNKGYRTKRYSKRHEVNKEQCPVFMVTSEGRVRCAQSVGHDGSHVPPRQEP